jgi:crotonobetainyl-CoA:carnitine CoA-transferase CaiB-like acyl-CoA transferase
VLDFSHFIAGPFATMMLADFGAEVIKVEPAGEGDGFRRYPPSIGDEAVPYLWTNRNKRSIALDLKEAAGREVALRLADSEPVRAEPSIMDITTALMACNGLLAAIVARERTGIGQHVEVTMIDSAINLLGNFSLAYLATGISPTRFGNTQTTASPVGCFETLDGPIYLACANDRTFRRLAVDVLGHPAWVDDPRFRDSAARRENQRELMALLGTLFRDRRRDELLALMHASGVPAGAVRSVAEALDAPEVAERGLLSEIAHRTLGTVPNVGLPIRLSATPLVQPEGAPPLGADTEWVLRELLGCDDAEIRMLAAAGALGTGRFGHAGS